MVDLYFLESNNKKMFKTLCDLFRDTDEDFIAAYDGMTISFEVSSHTIRGNHIIELLELLNFKRVRSINK